MSLLIDIKNGTKTHQLAINLATNKEIKNALYGYRYNVYRKYNLIEENDAGLDYDDYDDTSCYHFYATFDDAIVGSLRMIVGKTIPTIDLYYTYRDLPKSIATYTHDKIFEVGRIISTPYDVTNIVPRHFVLLALFHQCLALGKQLDMEVVVGALKKRVVDKLKSIDFPIKLIESYQLNYDPTAHHDPLVNFFNEELTGKICPVYLTKENAENFFDFIYANRILFKSIERDHMKLNSLNMFNLFLFLNRFKSY